MPKILQREIDKLKKMILAVGAAVEESVNKSVVSIHDLDERLAQKVVDNDAQIDQMEIDVEEECLKILALHQPVAIDLRFIVAVLKINNDLERIGDLAVNISERAVMLARTDRVPYPAEMIDEMSAKVKAMLKKSLDSLVNLDAALAREVCASDDEIDLLNRKVFDVITQELDARPNSAASLIPILTVSRSLERIADHTTNIAQDVLYMLEGEIVRHKNLG